MTNRIFFASFFLVLLFSCKQEISTSTVGLAAKLTYPAYGSVDKYDDRLGDVLEPDERMEQLASGFDWSEGPVWVDEEGGYLLFSDIPRNQLHKWAEGDTVAEVYLNPSGYTGEEPFAGKEPGSNRVLLDAEGRLILCQHGDRRMARMDAPLSDPKANFTTLVGAYEGKRLNSPNDAVYHPNGDLYFTDPPYGLPKQADDPGKELDFQGVYRFRESDGSLTLLTDTITRPNGIDVSPDGSFLVVANSDRERCRWTKYPIEADGNLGDGRILMDVTDRVPTDKGGCDGIDFHSKGYLFATGPGGVYVFHPDETLLGIIRTGQATANCAFDTAEDYLYITADSLLLRIAVL